MHDRVAWQVLRNGVQDGILELQDEHPEIIEGFRIPIIRTLTTALG